MQGVKFDDKHSYYHWGLMFKSRPVISPPTPKTKYVEVPGKSGAIDMTDTLTGYTQYQNRKISFEFIIMAGRENWPAIYSDLLDTLHGKKVRITFDDDPDYYYTGRVTVGKWDAEIVTAVITMSAEVEPYKTAVLRKRRKVTLTEEGVTVTVQGTKKPVVPDITATDDGVEVAFEGSTYTLKAGVNRIPDIVIRDGNNTLTFTGNGTAELSYEGGRF
jgi:predicted phage tail component-like protein